MFKQYIAYFFVILLSLAVLLYVSVKSFVETGEERFWLAVYFIFIPIIVSVYFYFKNKTKIIITRIGMSISVFIGSFMLLYYTPTVMDKVHEGVYVNWLLPYYVKAEGIYLDSVSRDEYYYIKHQRNLKVVKFYELMKKCENDEIYSFIAELNKGEDRLFVTESIINIYTNLQNMKDCQVTLKKGAQGLITEGEMGT